MIERRRGSELLVHKNEETIEKTSFSDKLLKKETDPWLSSVKEKGTIINKKQKEWQSVIEQTAVGQRNFHIKIEHDKILAVGAQYV